MVEQPTFSEDEIIEITPEMYAGMGGSDDGIGEEEERDGEVDEGREGLPMLPHHFLIQGKFINSLLVLLNFLLKLYIYKKFIILTKVDLI